MINDSKKKVRLTKREKFIVAACDPTCDNFATKKEVKLAYKKAAGHYFIEPDYEQVCAISPKGKREYFQYNWYSWADYKKKRYWQNKAMQCGRLWALGKCEEAYKLEDYIYEEQK